jgi:site-specific recombinase XerD
VPLGADVVALLRRYRVEQSEERRRLGPIWEDNDLVFPSESGSLLEDKRVHYVFRRICERAGVPLIRPYDLRHSSASLLLAAGVHPRVVAERLGHANVNLTLNTYSHVLPGLQQDASDTLEAMLRKATPSAGDRRP